MRIFNLYHEGNSYQTISNIYNKDKVMGKTNWKDSTILKILSNEIYKGDFVHGKRTSNPRHYGVGSPYKWAKKKGPILVKQRKGQLN